MLEGIYVLNKIAQTDMPNWWWIPMVCILVIGVILGIVFAIIEKKDKSIAFWIPIIIALLLTGVYVMILPNDIPTGEYTYQVTIDDTVNLKEFNNKYDIIKQEGEIYYIEEK